MMLVCSQTGAGTRGWELGILLLHGWDGSKFAVAPLAAQPTKKHAFQKLGVEPVGFAA
jgi:hypothetical protein